MRYIRWYLRWKSRLFPNGKREGVWKTTLILVGLMMGIGLLFWKLESRMSPMLMRYALAEVENTALKMANLAVEEAVREEEITYRDILVMETREDGMVTACRTDTAAINRLQSAVVSRLGEHYERTEVIVSVPIGNAFENSFLFGKGPDVRFTMVPIGKIGVVYGNDYESCGINQTRHSLYFTLNMTVLVSGARTSEKVSCSGTFPIAEAVIVGYVPESYADVNWNRAE
ncbi:MAG: sporulation protein YunB [Clostridia bacterium]|nr:sporulation protein YunB [Clostridia bacterium]